MVREADTKAYELDIKTKELEIREKEIRLKQWDVDNSAHEMRNTYLRENRSRADNLVKAILLISGGALTLSINGFLQGRGPKITGIYLLQLKWSWGLLFAAMVAAVVVVFTMIITGELHGKRWGEFLKDNKKELQQPKYLPIVSWFLGVSAVIACTIGLLMLANIAINTIV